MDGGERTSGIDRKEKKGESGKDTKGLRGVSVTGSRGKNDAKGEKGEKEGRGKSERIGVRDTMRGGEETTRFEYRCLVGNTSN